MKSKITLILALVAMVVLATGTAWAGVINVDVNDVSCVSGTGQPDPSSVVYCSIQDAIDDASTGDTINVAAGTYNGSVRIDKSLTLNGAQAGVDARTRSGPESVIDGASATANYYLVDLQADNVVLDGFEVTHPQFTGSADASGILTHRYGPYFNQRITNNIIHDIGHPGRTSVDFGAFAINSGPVNGLEIDHNLMYNITHNDDSAWNNAVIVWGSGPTLAENINIHDNKMYDIDGPASPTTHWKLYDGGIFISSGSANVTIDNNEFINTGEYGISGNIATGSALTITNNTISGSTVAGIRSMEKGDTITGNTISGTATGIWVTDQVDEAPTVHCNSIAGNTVGLQNDTSFLVDATSNWWGNADGPSGSGPGTGDAVSDDVDFSSWLTSASFCVPTLTCVGFDPPMDKTVSVKKKNRVLPLKMVLVDENNIEVTDQDIVAPPVVEIDVASADPTDPPGEEFLSAGKGDDGNQFVFSGTSWDFNLSSRNFSGSGTYTITVESGDPGEYAIDPTCTATFVIQ